MRRAAPLVVSFVLGCAGALAGAPARAGDTCDAERTIVLLRPGVDPDEAACAFARRYRGVVCRVYRHSVRGVTLRCAGPCVREALAKDPLVRAVEPDLRVRALGAGAAPVPAPAQVVPPGIRRIGADRAPPRARAGEVGVAVLDTGIDARHPDLRVAESVSFVEGAPRGADGNGHGTHCAGIIGAKDDAAGVVGVAPGARLYAVKVLDDDGGGSLSDVIAGVDWVARNADKVAVANMSLGVQGRSSSLREAIAAAVAAGVVFVVAAGNEATDVFGPDGAFDTADDCIPAAFPEVCAVSAMGDTDGRAGGAGAAPGKSVDDALARFSNFARGRHEDGPVHSPGGAIDVAAPGVSVLSTWPGGGMRALSGTSMAAPHVAGLAALVVAARGRDVNGDGRRDARDVFAVRQAIVGAAEPQAAWRADGATGDPDGNHEGLASAVRLPFESVVVVAPPTPAPVAFAPPADVVVVGLVAPALLAREERSRIVVGVRNRGAVAATFDVVVVDRSTGCGVGRRTVRALAPGVAATVAFACDGRTLGAASMLRAVVLPAREGGALTSR